MFPAHSKNPLQLFPLWFALGVGLVALVIFLSLTPKPPHLVNFAMSDKVGHSLAYAVLMGWFGQLYRGKLPLALFALGFTLLGVSMEYLQWLGRVRDFEYDDMLADIIGVIVGWILTVSVFKDTLAWVEKRLGLE
jgi:VanZ family protein